jgi:hypothetical protein
MPLKDENMPLDTIKEVEIWPKRDGKAFPF